MVRGRAPTRRLAEWLYRRHRWFQPKRCRRFGARRTGFGQLFRRVAEVLLLRYGARTAMFPCPPTTMATDLRISQCGGRATGYGTYCRERRPALPLLSYGARRAMCPCEAILTATT